jgi:polyribonucleotide 5'-hydroxyl-kinase
VDFTESVIIKLLSGTAEIFGMELSINREYEVRGCKLAILSYEGARIQLRGRCDVEYVSEETVVNVYLNTHLAIEGLRMDAVERQDEAPRVLVVGASRSTVTRTLLNYAVRAGRTPVYVNLDVANGNILLPGVIGAQVLERVIDVEDGIGEGQPCAYFYGSTAPADNSKLYRKMTNRLAFAVNGRLASMSDQSKSGAIICTGADCEEYIAEIQELFRASLVLVVGNERLHSTVSKTLSAIPNCTVLKLPKSGGVVSKDNNYRRGRLQAAFHRYFYGPKSEYSPFSIVLTFDEVRIRRLGEDVLAPKSALPLGAARKVDESRAAKVDPTNANLLYSILAVSNGKTEEEILDANIAGLIYV